MCDCRLCRNAYRIWHDEIENPEDVKFKLVCMKKELFIDWEYVTEGPCEDYVDVDSNYSEE